MALVTSQIPLACASSVLCSCIMYYLGGQPMQLFRLLLFINITVLTSITASSYGLLIGSRLRLLVRMQIALKDIRIYIIKILTLFQNSIFMGPNIISVWVMLANYAVDRNELSFLENFIIYTSFIRHAIEGLMSSLFLFERGDFFCPPTEIICLMKKPQYILKLTGNSNINYIRSASFLLGFYLLFTGLAWFVFKCRFSRIEFLENNSFYRRIRHLQMKYFFSKSIA